MACLNDQREVVNTVSQVILTNVLLIILFIIEGKTNLAKGLEDSLECDIRVDEI